MILRPGIDLKSTLIALAGILASNLIALLHVAAHDLAAPPGIDLTHLPLGDKRISEQPKAGWIWACRIEGPEGRGGGAGVNGPWIQGDTYDLTAKAVVSGSVTWPFRFAMSIDGGKRVFTSNDLPNHPTGVFPISPSDEAYKTDRNPNRIAEKDMRVDLPLMPVLAPQPACVPGAVGILLSGVVLFSALDAMGRDAVAHEVQDDCQGHPQITGTYHYHSVTKCLPDKRLANGHSDLVGYALDGFGIYGPYGENGKPLTSAELDACHGHTHAILWEGKMVEMYHYHATWDFPYTIGCMRGAYSLASVMAVSGGPPETRRDAGRLPDLNAAAAKLGISPDRLREALGFPPPNMPAAAARLGISVEALREALFSSVPK